MIEIEIPLANWTLRAKHKKGKGPNIIAFHGWLDNAGSFDYIAPLIDANIIALDWPGHGLSDHLPQGVIFHLPDLIYDAIATINYLGWDKCIILGHSLGAAVGSLMAGCYPERIQANIFIDGLGPLAAPTQNTALLMRKALDQHLSLGQKTLPVHASFEKALEKRAQISSMSPQEILPVVQRGIKPCEGGFTWRTDPRLLNTSTYYLSEEQTKPFLEAITAPTLLIKPSDGFNYAPADLMLRAQWVKNLQIAHTPGHHHVHLQHPKTIAQLINSYLTSFDAKN